MPLATTSVGTVLAIGGLPIRGSDLAGYPENFPAFQDAAQFRLKTPWVGITPTTAFERPLRFCILKQLAFELVAFLSWRMSDRVPCRVHILAQLLLRRAHDTIAGCADVAAEE